MRDMGSIPGQEDPLKEEMATYSIILASKVPWREEPGRLQSMGSHRVGHYWATEKAGRLKKKSKSLGIKDKLFLNSLEYSLVLEYRLNLPTPKHIPGLPRWLSWSRIHLQCKRPQFVSKVGKIGKIPWRRHRLPIPVFWGFCGESDGKENYNLTDAFTPMITAALFTTAKTRKQLKCLSTDEWMKKVWYMYTMEYYSGIKK